MNRVQNCQPHVAVNAASEYQRLLGWLLLILTAITFFPPMLRYGVKSYSKELYPYGRIPKYVPFIHTWLFHISSVELYKNFLAGII